MLHALLLLILVLQVRSEEFCAFGKTQKACYIGEFELELTTLVLIGSEGELSHKLVESDKGVAREPLSGRLVVLQSSSTVVAVVAGEEVSIFIPVIAHPCKSDSGYTRFLCFLTESSVWGTLYRSVPAILLGILIFTGAVQEFFLLWVKIRVVQEFGSLLKSGSSLVEAYSEDVRSRAAARWASFINPGSFDGATSGQV